MFSTLNVERCPFKNFTQRNSRFWREESKSLSEKLVPKKKSRASSHHSSVLQREGEQMSSFGGAIRRGNFLANPPGHFALPTCLGQNSEQQTSRAGIAARLEIPCNGFWTRAADALVSVRSADRRSRSRWTDRCEQDQRELSSTCTAAPLPVRGC